MLQLGYIAIMFGLIPGLLVSGFMMNFSEQLPEALIIRVCIGH